MDSNKVEAFLLITVPARMSGEVVHKLIESHGDVVKEAAAVYGEADVVAKVEVNSVEKLHDLVMNKIQRLDHVEVTRTFIIIPSLHKFGNRDLTSLAG